MICFQELFYGPYFGITQDQKYYRYAEPADGPIVQRFAALAKELGMVMVLPIYEEEQTGVYYNTAVVVDADGTILGKYRKHHIPHLDKFWEKFYFRPGNLGYPVFDTAVGKVGIYICYDRHFPEGWRELGLNGAHMVFNPNATKPGLSQPALGGRGPVRRRRQRLLRAPAQPRRPRGQRVRRRGRRLLRHQPGHRPARQLRRASAGSRRQEELLVRDLDLDMVRQMRDDWQFYRDRRPDSYTAIARPEGLETRERAPRHRNEER